MPSKLKLFNTLTKKVEVIKPADGKVVRMYTCGPTVYLHSHIGNLRGFIVPDLIYRTLKANGYEVQWTMNITDIDDKTIKGAVDQFGAEATIDNLQAYTSQYTSAFLADLRKVNVLVDEINIVPVTSVITEIQHFIERLIEKGYAYIAEDGSTYFSIEKYQADFGDYGALVGEKFLEGKKVGARVKVDEYDKDNLSDFALWKAHTADDANIFWDHPKLGKGRPGWHIECSVINKVAFGDNPIDIHTGGVDLIFPHHTNEIAQSQPLGPFVNTWIHHEHILIDNQKMSKRYANFYTLEDLERKGFSGLDLRYTYLQGHYKTQQNFTWDSIEASQKALKKLKSNVSIGDDKVPGKFLEAFNDNLNAAEALAVAWEDKNNLLEYDKILGLRLDEQEIVEIPEEVNQLLDERQIARDNKDFAKSDELRDKISALGFDVKDTGEGQQVNKK